MKKTDGKFDFRYEVLSFGLTGTFQAYLTDGKSSDKFMFCLDAAGKRYELPNRSRDDFDVIFDAAGGKTGQFVLRQKQADGSFNNGCRVNADEEVFKDSGMRLTFSFRRRLLSKRG